MYTDDPATCDNLELKLVDGRLRLRMNTGAGDLANTEIEKRKILDTTGDCIAAKFSVEIQSTNNSQHIHSVSIESREIPLANTKIQKHKQKPSNSLGSGPTILESSPSLPNLGDGSWHRVRVVKLSTNTTLEVRPVLMPTIMMSRL